MEKSLSLVFCLTQNFSFQEGFKGIIQKVSCMAHDLSSEIILLSFKIKLNRHFTVCFLNLNLLRWKILNIFNGNYFLKSIHIVANFCLKKILYVLFATFCYWIVRLKPFFDNSYKFFIFLLYFFVLLFKFEYFAFSIQFHVNTWNTCKLVISFIINQFVPRVW